MAPQNPSTSSQDSMIFFLWKMISSWYGPRALPSQQSSGKDGKGADILSKHTKYIQKFGQFALMSLHFFKL